MNNQEGKQEINQIPNAVKVKEASLLKILNPAACETKYVVMHYNTIILEIVYNLRNGKIEREVINCSAKTASSRRAVRQALTYLESEKTITMIEIEQRSNVERILI